MSAPTTITFVKDCKDTVSIFTNRDHHLIFPSDIFNAKVAFFVYSGVIRSGSASDPKYQGWSLTCFLKIHTGELVIDDQRIRTFERDTTRTVTEELLPEIQGKLDKSDTETEIELRRLTAQRLQEVQNRYPGCRIFVTDFGTIEQLVGVEVTSARRSAAQGPHMSAL